MQPNLGDMAIRESFAEEVTFRLRLKEWVYLKKNVLDREVHKGVEVGKHLHYEELKQTVQCGGEVPRFQSQMAWVWIPAMPPTCCVTLEKLHNLSGPWFPHLYLPHRVFVIVQ